MDFPTGAFLAGLAIMVIVCVVWLYWLITDEQYNGPDDGYTVNKKGGP